MTAASVAVALLAAAWFGSGGPRPRPTLLLFTTLPLYWGEAGEVGAMLAPGRTPHWARDVLEERWALEPTDTLDAAALRGRTSLLMVQPRPLSPDENVALDAWVAAGGRLLLFADPALTADSAFALGDRRRPQDVVLLSPILARWGLALAFDEAQQAGERSLAVGSGVTLPVDLPGRLALQAGGRGDARCRIEPPAVLARCRIGRGAVAVVADAALFEDRASPDDHRRALERLIALAL